MPTAPNKVLCKCFSFCAVFGILVSAAAQNMRASSSVGQSWRLITAWSRVQVLAGPPKKHEILLSCFSFCMNRRFTCTILCSSVSESHHVVCRRPACRLQGSYWAVRVRLPRLLSPHQSPGWTRGCSQKCAETYADGFSRLGVHITEHMIRWPFLFAPIAADPAFCRKLHQIPPFAQ